VDVSWTATLPPDRTCLVPYEESKKDGRQ
jgi:hypothetical protein